MICLFKLISLPITIERISIRPIPSPYPNVDNLGLEDVILVP